MTNRFRLSAIMLAIAGFGHGDEPSAKCPEPPCGLQLDSDRRERQPDAAAQDDRTALGAAHGPLKPVNDFDANQGLFRLVVARLTAAERMARTRARRRRDVGVEFPEP